MDNLATAARRDIIRPAWRALKKFWLGTDMTVEKIGPDKAVVTKETYTATPEGTVQRQVMEETVEWHDLPPNIRGEFIRNNTNKAKMDFKEATIAEVERRAQKAGLELTLAD
jgi:hypothetical protein